MESRRNIQPTNSFPIFILPEKIQKIVGATEKVLGFPIDFICCALLHAASIAIGGTVVTKYKWEEAFNLFMVLLGDPGTNKSAPLRFAYDPLFKRDQKLYEQYIKEKEQYNFEFEHYKNNKSLPIPQKPVLNRHIISDITIEALIVELQKELRGVCVLVDELAGWIYSFTRYGSSTTVTHMLSMFNRAPIIYDRKGGDCIRINEHFVGVIGGIQEEVMIKLMKGDLLGNGMVQRLLIANPELQERHRWSWDGLDENIRENWRNIIDNCLGIDYKVDEEGKKAPLRLRVHEDAEKLLIEWQHRNVETDKNDEVEGMKSISAKLEIYVLRFAGLLQTLGWACGERHLHYISKESMYNAIELAKYFKANARKLLCKIHFSSPLDHLSEVKLQVYEKLREQFRTSDGVETANSFGMPERSFKYWIATDTKLFKRTGHGRYKKVYKG